MLSLQVKRTENLKEQVYRKLKSLLTGGHFEPNVFYSANQFAERLGVSRTPAREALLQLEAEGFLVAQDNRGFRLKTFSPKEARDFFEMRLLMETYAVGKLCESLCSADVRMLEECLKRMRAACENSDAKELIASDEEFHAVLIGRCDNQFLTSLIRNIRDFIAIFGRRMVERDTRMSEVVEEHAAILRALKARNREQAVQALTGHLQKTQARLLQSLEGNANA